MRHCGQNQWRGTRQKRIRVGGKLAEHLQIPTSECLTDECPGRRWCVGERGNLSNQTSSLFCRAFTVFIAQAVALFTLISICTSRQKSETPAERCSCVVIIYPCCRERPSALRVDGPGQGGVEAGGQCYPIVQDPTGPIPGAKP